MQQATQEDLFELDRIKDFQRGYVYFLTSFQTLVASFIQFLLSGNISEQNKRDLLPYRKALDLELNHCHKQIKDIIFNLDERHMQPLVKKEYSRHFQGGYVDGPRTEFVQFHMIFEMLRNFTMDSRASWLEIKRSITEGKFTDPVFRDDSLLHFRINAALDKLECIAIFLKRMAFILGIDNYSQILETRNIKAKFRDNVIYKLSSVFSDNLYADPRTATEDSSGPFAQNSQFTAPVPEAPNRTPLSSVKENAKPSEVIPEASVKIQKKAPDGSANYIQAFGKYSWNSDQHYFFRYEVDKYQTERALFNQTISMDIHLGADEQMLRSELIKTLSSIRHKSKSSEEYENAYLKFLDSFFDFIENIVIMNLGIPNQLKWVFIFHIGPSHFYMIAKKFLMEVNTGYLHVKSLDGKKVSRLIPGEVVKKHVIDYWNRVILPNVGEEKNNLALLKRIIEVVSDKYKEASAHAMTEYDKLPEEIRSSKKIDELFRENMNHWIGAANIIVFKRFVKNKSI